MLYDPALVLEGCDESVGVVDDDEYGSIRTPAPRPVAALGLTGGTSCGTDTFAPTNEPNGTCDAGSGTGSSQPSLDRARALTCGSSSKHDTFVLGTSRTDRSGGGGGEGRWHDPVSDPVSSSPDEQDRPRRESRGVPLAGVAASQASGRAEDESAGPGAAGAAAELSKVVMEALCWPGGPRGGGPPERGRSIPAAAAATRSRPTAALSTGSPMPLPNDASPSPSPMPPSSTDEPAVHAEVPDVDRSDAAREAEEDEADDAPDDVLVEHPSGSESDETST